MHPYLTEAFLLRSIPYGETDLVVTMITPTGGQIGCLARSARKSAKRFGAPLDFFNLLHAELKPAKSSMAKLMRVELLKTFERPRRDMEAYFTAGHFLEIIRLAGREGDSSPELFTLLKTGLEALEGGGEPKSLARVFQIRLISLLGYSLGGARCVECQVEFSTGASLVNEALHCDDCAGQGGERLSQGAVRTLAGALTVEFGKLRLPSAIEAELGPIVERALTRALGKEPKSLSMGG